MLVKLTKYGISDGALKLISSYLSQREQAVQTTDAKAPFLPVELGVPQGSIFEPLFFLVMINDLPHVNLLMLNGQKTHYMLFSTRRREPLNLNITLDFVQIARVSKTRFLGCILDEKLDATAHTEDLAKKLSQAIFVVRRLCALSGNKMGKELYQAYVHSHLNYFPDFWGMALKTKLRRIFRLQRRAILATLPPSDTIRLSLWPEEVGILPPPLALTYSMCTFLHKQIIGNGPRMSSDVP